MADIRVRAPNKVGGRVAAESTTSWRIMAMQPGLPDAITGYASVAAMQTAGAVPWPNLEGGALLTDFTIRAENGSGADAASDVYYAMNTATAPTDDTLRALVDPAQQFTDHGCRNLWVRKVGAADRIIVTGRY